MKWVVTKRLKNVIERGMDGNEATFGDILKLLGFIDVLHPQHIRRIQWQDWLA